MAGARFGLTAAEQRKTGPLPQPGQCAVVVRLGSPCKSPGAMVPGLLACPETPIPAFGWRLGGSSDLGHRKSATTVDAPNEHPSRVFQQPPAGLSHASSTRRGLRPVAAWAWRRRCVAHGSACGMLVQRLRSVDRSVGGGLARPLSAWSWCSDWSGCSLVWLSALALLRAERVGAAGAVAETRSSGGPWPSVRAARLRRAALIQ